jgi:hypothetical protein
MLFQQRFLDGVRSGTITLAFRRWRRPSVRTGGTLLTPVGKLDIVSVSQVELTMISEADARRAGYESREQLLTELEQRADGRPYRIELGPLRHDPRIALRESAALTADEQRGLLERLKRFDSHATGGAWTERTLELIDAHPGLRAADLCRLIGQDKDVFKLNVRKLKNLGLTESLEVGYRLSPRGAALVRAIRQRM